MEPKVKFKGGGSFVAKSPQFSADGQTIYVLWKNVIIVYNTKTAKRIRELRGLIDPIVNFSVHQVDNFEYVTACSTSGEIISWKVEIGFRVLKLNVPINDAVTIESFNLVTPLQDYSEQNRKFLISYTSNSDENVLHFGLFKIANKKCRKLMLKVPRDKYKPYFAVSRGQYPFFAVAQGRKLYFLRLKDDRNVAIHALDKNKHFTCLSCHPDEECLITGDSLGRVILWYNLGTREPSRAVYHWHTLPVRTLSFSASGTNFYSGAGECVLVKWYLDYPNQKDFLPRLPAAVEHVTVASENQFVAVATADNAIQVLDSRLETISVIQHLVLGTHFPAGVAFDHRTRTMVLNGLTGHVQFYSPHDKMLLYNLDVVGQNKLTQERNCHIENTNVTKIAIDSWGLWLATVEERVDVSYSFELRLKFWGFNTVKQLFELNTSVELPHEKSVTHILFQPSYGEDLRCVTVGNDRKFKVWRLINADTIYHKGNAWKCTRVGFYRDMPCNALSFSSDGSLLGVGFGPTVTTWLPDTCELKCSLLHPKNRERLTSLQFGTSNQCHLLVSTTSEQLSVWNLLSLSMIWTVPLHVSLLVANSVYPHMAVFTTDRKLFIFNPGSSQPIFTQTLERDTENVVAAAFLQTSTSGDANLNWWQGSQLFFVTSKQELFCLDADEDHTDSIDILSESLSSGLFSSTIPKNKAASAQQFKPVQHLTDISCKNQQLKQLLDAPVHTMVPIRLTCGSILKSIIFEHTLPKQTDVT